MALTAVEGVLNKHGSLLTIEGEAGIGKSRLAREIVAGRVGVASPYCKAV